MTAIMVAQTMFGQPPGLRTIMNKQTLELFPTGPIIAHGFDAGPDYYGASNFGSIVQATYKDDNGTNRTVSSCYWSDAGFLYFALDTTNEPDTNAVMTSIKVDDGTTIRTFLRTNAFYRPNTNGGTNWDWVHNSPNPMGSNGNHTFEVVVS